MVNELSHLEALADYNDMWYLREGDFLPEKVSNLFLGKGVTYPAHAIMLMDAGNIFRSRKEAEDASAAVRELLLARRASHTGDESTNTGSRIRLSPLLSICRRLQSAAEQILETLPTLQARIQEIDGGHNHSATEANGQERRQV